MDFYHRHLPLKYLFLEGCTEVLDLNPLGGCVQLDGFDH